MHGVERHRVHLAWSGDRRSEGHCGRWTSRLGSWGVTAAVVGRRTRFGGAGWSTACTAYKPSGATTMMRSSPRDPTSRPAHVSIIQASFEGGCGWRELMYFGLAVRSDTGSVRCPLRAQEQRGWRSSAPARWVVRWRAASHPPVSTYIVESHPREGGGAARGPCRGHPAEAAQQADVVISSLTNDAAIRDVYLGGRGAARRRRQATGRSQHGGTTDRGGVGS